MARAPGEKLSTELAGLVASGDDWIERVIEAWHLKAPAADLSYRLSFAEPRVDPGWFHPSSLGNECDANLAFQFLGIYPKEDRFQPRTLRIFDNGHGRDQAWKVYLREAGVSLITAETDPERRCPKCNGRDWDGRHICIPELRIRGDFDDLVRNPLTGETGIFEFKTKKLSLFSKLVAPDPEYVIQVQPYMYAKEQAVTWQTYECKDDQELKTFRLPFNHIVWQQTVDRIHRILAMLGTGGTPSRGCKYACQFAECPTANFVELVDSYRANMGLA